ncbi:hypothetical protein CC1G_02701 [Coprinopsis cinerea okayama7|uniref:Uncharacterized protein n=1 Tax=Coprinopsis cinerea (strain Okayama-7 / 130 / ATCC MYA-4618 / FGSC 9003) TaxID=240176 RepID=A8PBP8_COPC7|nr:hypothetical protein CC1G_02701 [Coprinopsis cinerea okayama7\|eukprot:XP_001840238.2 hypothetical protein CC1G_02701 [Coprinopsis cinerea okayama7\
MRRSLPLPVELLGVIFCLATAGCKIQDLTNLTRVCTDFRTILFATPLFWTDLLVVFTHNTDLRKLIAQLGKLFKRSQKQWVRLSLNYESDMPHHEINILNDFLLDTGFTFRLKGLSVRFSKSVDLGHLGTIIRSGRVADARRIFNDWDFFTQFLEIAGAKDVKPFEDLEYLSLNVLDMAVRLQSQTFRRGFPNLKVLALNCSPRYGQDRLKTIDWAGIDLKGLKALTIVPFHDRDGLELSAYHLHTILSGAPDLESLNLSIPPQPSMTGAPPGPLIDKVIIVHESLTELVLSGGIEDMARLLSNLALPKLRSLRLEGANSDHGSRRLARRVLGTGILSKVEKLVRDSGCALKELMIDFQITWAEEQLAELRALLPAMARLTLT